MKMANEMTKNALLIYNKTNCLAKLFKNKEIKTKCATRFYCSFFLLFNVGGMDNQNPPPPLPIFHIFQF